jgi:ATP-dependent DNA helicase RecQ
MITASTLDKHQILKQAFGYDSFRGKQAEAIDAVLAGHDCLTIFPTGSGKSLCFQIPALMLEGVTVVVSPLIALMLDQVNALQAKGIPATFINSSLSQADYSERMDMIRAGEYKLVYVAPERFSNEKFMEMMTPVKVSLFACDELHCISKDGHDFRPDYLKLGPAAKKLGRPRIIGLTATATPEVRRDCIKQLDLQNPKLFVDGFERPNLTFSVEPVSGEETKLSRVIQKAKKGKTGIVYCSTHKNVEMVYGRLKINGIKCLAYHGGMKDDDRTRVQNQFMQGDAPVVVATNAFGMGIDRSDLRFIIHFDIPGSVEALYQESGRGGRDGQPSDCLLLYDNKSVRTQEFFIAGANPTRDIIQSTYSTIQRLCSYGSIHMSVDTIAEYAKQVRNPIAIGGALKILERQGAISRWYESGSRTYHTALLQPVRDLDDLGIDFSALDVKRMRDTERLNKVVQYAQEYRQCRQGYILGYFGETYRKCGRCDICKGKS